MMRWSLLFIGSAKRPYLRDVSIQITPGSPLRTMPSMIGSKLVPTETSTELLDIHAQPCESAS